MKNIHNCFECQSPNNIVHHHVVPQSLGGKNTIPLCQPCHDKVHSLKPRNISLSSLIKNGMQKWKQQHPDRTFGSPNINEVSKIGRVANRQKCLDFYKNIKPTIVQYYNQGHTLKQIAHTLNQQNIKTRYSKPWSEVTVWRIINKH
jgi:predicted HNH restriction endonuclease